MFRRPNKVGHETGGHRVLRNSIRVNQEYSVRGHGMPRPSPIFGIEVVPLGAVVMRIR
jgi:hypothetical protein